MQRKANNQKPPANDDPSEQVDRIRSDGYGCKGDPHDRQDYERGNGPVIHAESIRDNNGIVLSRP